MPREPLAIPNHRKSLTSVFVTVTRALSRALGGSSSMSRCDQYFSCRQSPSAWESRSCVLTDGAPGAVERRGGNI